MNDDVLESLDAPRPLRPRFREALERALIEGDTAAPPAALPGGLDVPRPLPDGLRERLEAALIVDRPRRRWAEPLPRVVLAAATAVAVLASILVVSRGDGPLPDGRSRPPSADERADGPRLGRRPADASPASPGPRTTSRAVITVPRPDDRPLAAPPPFAFRGPAPAAAAASSDAPVRLRVLGGDEAVRAGFDAYLDLLNRDGGIAGRRVERADSGTIATVNLGPQALDGPVAGPVLETLTAPEASLTGSVFSVASPPERQAHLLVDAVFPEADSSAVAVIYRGTDGIYAEQIPAALREALEARQVRVVEAAYQPGRAVPLVPADAAFLSLDQQDTLRFLDYSRGYGYRPPRAVACIFPMLDEGIVDRLEDGYLVLSPYSLGPDDERGVLERLSGRPAGSATIHGWVTAKSLAVALWRTGADTADEATAALRALDGYDHGFAPPYRVRPGTNVRTPEGLLYEVRDGAFVARGGFRTDPF